tara:strand:- start:551 stop:838 length:288 start_codon:yes stop_codon:yes gene_type:complete
MTHPLMALFATETEKVRRTALENVLHKTRHWRRARAANGPAEKMDGTWSHGYDAGFQSAMRYAFAAVVSERYCDRDDMIADVSVLIRLSKLNPEH